MYACNVFSSEYNNNYYNDDDDDDVTTVEDNNQLEYKITDNNDFKVCDKDDKRVAKQRLHQLINYI